MQQIVYFFQKSKYFLFFLFLEAIALFLTFNNLNFHQSKFVSSANEVSGSIFSNTTNLIEYLDLKEINILLLNENIALKNRLEKITSSKESTSINDSIKKKQKFVYFNGRIEKNEFNSNYNYLLINKGKKDGITAEMAVVNTKGVIGITDYVTENYARVQSILNKNSKINARLKGSQYYGTLEWNGNNHQFVQLIDIPKQAIFQIGDTIETDGKSTIFPEKIPIGTISKIYSGSSVDQKIDVQLFNDMRFLNYIYVIKNNDIHEIKSLENLGNE